MSRLLSFFLVFLLIAALFVHFPSVRAEESETDSEIEIENDSAASASSSSSEGVTDTGSDSPIEDGAEIELEEPVSGVHYNNDLTTRVYFPTSAEKKFFQGEEVVLLVGVSNHGSKPYNLSAVAARLRSPYDFSIVQNYSAVWVNSALEAGKEMTVAYKFKPYEGLDPLEFPVEAFLFYNNTETGDMFQSTLFNSTITIVERDAAFNPQTFFTYVLFIGLAGFGVYSLLPASATKKRSKKGVAEQAAVEWTVDDYKPATKSKVARRSRK